VKEVKAGTQILAGLGLRPRTLEIVRGRVVKTVPEHQIVDTLIEQGLQLVAEEQ
jgi:hypothetical protein